MSEPIRGNAHISDGCRFWLVRQWDQHLQSLLVVMFNPSTADASRDDPTMRRVLHFARRWRFGSVCVVNLFPWITADKSAAIEWAREALAVPGYFDPYRRDQLEDNLAQAKRRYVHSEAVLVAWGNLPSNEFDRWADHFMETLAGGVMMRRPTYCLGLTKRGDPKHPLARGKHRVPDSQDPIRWPHHE